MLDKLDQAEFDRLVDYVAPTYEFAHASAWTH